MTDFTDYLINYEDIVTNEDSYLTNGYSLDLSLLALTDVFPTFTLPTMSWTSDWTIECFVKTTVQNPGVTPVFAVSDGSNYVMCGEQSTSGIGRVWLSKPSEFDQTFSGSFGDSDDLDRWMHTCIQYDSVNNTGTIYRDGQFGVRNHIVEVATGSPVEIGHLEFYSTSKSLTGFVSNIRVSDVLRYDTGTYVVPDPTLWSSTDANVVMYADFSAPAPTLELTPYVLSISAGWTAVSGAVSYDLEVIKTSDSSTVTYSSVDVSLLVSNLSPGEEYTINLSSIDSIDVTTFVSSSSTTTLENTSSNYDITIYGESGNFDLSSLDETSLETISSILNELFVTDDLIDVSVNGTTVECTFSNLNATIPAFPTGGGLLIPFDSTLGSGQEISITLDDTTIVSVTYDESSGKITYDGTEYGSGDTFYINGKKIRMSTL